MVEVVVPRRTGARSLFTGMALVGLVAAGVVGGSPGGIRDRLWRVGAGTAAPAPARWQDVVELQGDGSAVTAAFAVDRYATEWRVQWSCEYGHLLVDGVGARPVVDTACPRTGTGFANRTGTTALNVATNGRWTLKVQQHMGRPPKAMAGERM